MAKTPFLLLIFSLVGVIATPQFLAATDVVELTRVDMSAAVETVPLPEPEPEPTPVVVAKAPVAGAVRSASTPTSTPVAPTMRNYTITAVTGQIVANPSYNNIYRTGKFIYAHNTAGLLGNIGSLQDGEVFTLTEGGVVKTYRVAFKQMYEKSQANGMLNGSKPLTIDVEVKALGHSISMMTCAGRSLGNGDATHRLVVFADQI